MGRNDDFPAPVRAALAAEAGQRCANPHCRLRTLGPSDTAATGTANIGVAAHITAAQPGGARYDADMASSVRKSAHNGIWLCQNHAHLVDHNSKRYTVGLLCAWKRRARELTMAELAGQRFVDRSAGLIPHYRRFAEFAKSPEAWRGVCAEMVEDATPKEFWEAQKRELVQLTLYELGLNAFEHGGANWVSIRSRGFRFELRHTGDRFHPQGAHSRAWKWRGRDVATTRSLLPRFGGRAVHPQRKGSHDDSCRGVGRWRGWEPVRDLRPNIDELHHSPTGDGPTWLL